MLQRLIPFYQVYILWKGHIFQSIALLACFAVGVAFLSIADPDGNVAWTQFGIGLGALAFGVLLAVLFLKRNTSRAIKAAPDPLHHAILINERTHLARSMGVVFFGLSVALVLTIHGDMWNRYLGISLILMAMIYCYFWTMGRAARLLTGVTRKHVQVIDAKHKEEKRARKAKFEREKKAKELNDKQKRLDAQAAEQQRVAQRQRVQQGVDQSRRHPASMQPVNAVPNGPI